MEIGEYESKAAQFAVFPPDVAEAYTALGLASEAGEAAGAVKKWLRGDIPYEELQHRLEGELGDVLWYVAAMCHAYDLSMDGVARSNLSKLQRRQLNDTLKGDGSDR